MANVIHTIHRGPEGRFYAFGTESSFLFFSPELLQDLTVYSGDIPWDGQQVFGSFITELLPLWFVSKPVVTNGQDFSKNPALFQFYVQGRYALDYPIKLQVKIGANNTFAYKDEFSGLWSDYFKIENNRPLPLKFGLEIIFNAPTSFIEETTWELSISLWPTTKEKVSAFNYDNRAYFVSADTVLHVVQDNLVQSLLDTKDISFAANLGADSVINLTGNYITEFFEHAVVARKNYIQWSNLRNFWQWAPNKHSEADFKILEWEDTDVTWMGQVGDVLYVHFPTQIYRITYVGRPHVMNITKLPKFFGCAFPYALTVFNGVQFYLGLDDFYAFDGQVPQPIGSDILKRFHEKVEPKFLDKTWAFYDLINKRIGWAFVSKGQTVYNGCDRAILYDYAERHWTFITLENCYCHAILPEPVEYEPIGLALGTITSDGGQLSSPKTPTLRNVWGKEGALLTDSDDDTVVTDLLPSEAPFLETADLIYDNIHDYKDNDLVIIDADYDENCLGIDVYVSARDFVSAPVTYELVGRWQKTNRGKQLDYRMKSGRVYRFKFVPIGGDSGLKKFELYAWGERVLLPNNTIGPEQ
jgi:hypothetical protein